MSNKFIVMYKDHAEDQQIQDHIQKIKAQGGEVGAEYSIIKGFAATIPDSFLNELKSLQSADGIIESIEPDQVVKTC